MQEIKDMRRSIKYKALYVNLQFVSRVFPIDENKDKDKKQETQAKKVGRHGR